MGMREARLVLPMNGNNMTPTQGDAARAEIKDGIVRMFGGFTSHFGYGSWRDDDGKIDAEPIQVFDIAMPDVPDSNVRLRQLAAVARDTLHQKAVYVRYTDGAVELV